MKIWIALTFLLTSCTQNYEKQEGIGLSGESNSIVGGTTVIKEDPTFKKILSFRTYKDPKPTNKGDVSYISYTVTQCTASAVAPKIILTAAHCISSDPNSFAQVPVHLPEGGTVNYKAVKTVIHPDYNDSNQKPDLALVLLEAELPADIEILELPQKSEDLNLLSISAAGFGRISGKQSVPGQVGIPRKTELMVLDYFTSTPNFHVDQSQGKGICQGDSGGPAMITKNEKTYVVGVASKTIHLKEEDGKEVDFCNYQGLYVNVQYFMDWVQPTMASMDN
ncbi:MAG: S1 family peptidase [Bdellovibrio sp.]